VFAVALRMMRPTSVDPVNAILSMSGCATIAAPGLARAVHHIQHARRQPNLLGDLGQQDRRQRRVLRRLDDHRVARGQRRRHLPRKHQQRKVPRNNLPHHTHRLIAGKLLIAQLRPARMIVKVPRHQRNINVPRLADRLAIVQRLQHSQPRECFCTCRASAYRYRARWCPVSACHPGSAARAAFTAASTSSALAVATFASTSPVAGFFVSNSPHPPRPLAVDEVPKRPPTRVEPLGHLASVFRRGAVLHRFVLFHNAAGHTRSCGWAYLASKTIVLVCRDEKIGASA
jgi:hypothetical protein